MQTKIAKILGIFTLFTLETLLHILYLGVRITNSRIQENLFEFIEDWIQTFGFLKVIFLFPIYLIYHLSIDYKYTIIKISFQHACLYMLMSVFMVFLPFGNPSRGIDFLINFIISFCSCWLVYKCGIIKQIDRSSE